MGLIADWLPVRTEVYLCYVGVARVEGDWKTRGWDSNIYTLL